jgi:hypothetical protein
MKGTVKNIDYFKKKFIEKANKKHNNLYNYDNVNYINSIEKVEIICPSHGSFYLRPDAHIRKVGCPDCKGGVKYTPEKWISIAKSVHKSKYDYSKTNYINSKEKVEIICSIHGSFFMRPPNHLTGQGCANCVGLNRKTNNDFKNESILIHSNVYDYSLVEYKNNKTKVKIICKKHGIFEQVPKEHLNGHGCRFCNLSQGEKMIESILEALEINYIREFIDHNCVSDLGKNLPFDFYIPNIKTLIEYDGRQHQEPVDLFGGEIAYNKLKITDNLRNKWCDENGFKLIRIKYNDVNDGLEEFYKYLIEKSIININKGISIINSEGYLEKSKFDINLFLESRRELINYIREIYKDEFILNYKIDDYSCDLFLPNKKLAIKLIGLFKNSELNKNNQLNTYNAFNNNGIKIIQIFEDQWINKKEIVKSRLNNLIGKNSEKIYARNCEIRYVNNKEVNIFLNENHIQGNIGSKIKLGLYYKEDLVSIMIFGQLRKNLGQVSKKDSWEILRFCNKKNHNIIGSASKLFSYFIKNHNPNIIISYGDKCWTNNDNIYSKLKMDYIYETKPSYFYIIGNVRKGRFAYRKDQLLEYGFDSNLTEHKICLMNNIFRIHDCGVFKYIWSKLDS